MEVVWSANIDHVDIGPTDNRPSMGLSLFPSLLASHLLELRLIPAADRLKLQLKGKLEEMAGLMKCIRMRPAHKTVADQRDIQFPALVA
jgi:hypothetical protein